MTESVLEEENRYEITEHGMKYKEGSAYLAIECPECGLKFDGLEEKLFVSLYHHAKFFRKGLKRRVYFEKWCNCDKCGCEFKYKSTKEIDDYRPGVGWSAVTMFLWMIIWAIILCIAEYFGKDFAHDVAQAVKIPFFIVYIAIPFIFGAIRFWGGYKDKWDGRDDTWINEHFNTNWHWKAATHIVEETE